MVDYKDRDVGTYHKWTHPFTLNAFYVELKQPLQKLWEKAMDKYMDLDKHKDSTVAI